MSLSHKFIIAAVVLLLVSSVSASADWTKTSYLNGTLTTGYPQGLKCDALVTFLDGIYTYSYTLTYSGGLSPIHTYKVYNPNQSAFFSAINNDGFTNPADGTANQVSWINGTVQVGESFTFTYQSYYAPMEIDVYTVAIDTGKSATGKTLGMGAVIPEPSSMAALLFGAVALVPFARRRK